MLKVLALAASIDAMALDAALVRTVQCSKEARKTLASGAVPVRWLEISADDAAAARALEASGALGRSTKCDHGAPGWEAFNAESRREFETLYAPSGLDPANNELDAASAIAIARSLDLGPADALLDLGSSAGSFVLAAASLGASARGVELSPRSHGVAEAARERFEAAYPAAPPVAFFNADCRDVDLSPYTVLYCAIRGVSSRPKVLDDLLVALAARDAETRLVCAGFGVDLKRKPYADRVAMAGATVLARPGAAEDAPAAERSLPLYGYDEGPRVLVEYVVRGVAR